MSDFLIEADPAIPKADLAAAFRLAVRFGLHEGICNHFSVKVSGGDGRYVINPMGRHWAEMRARDLVTLDHRGTIVEGEGPVEITAFRIHAALHRARPDAVAVLHTHMPYATALGLIEGGEILPCHQNSLRFFDAVAWDRDYNGLALDTDEGARLAAAIGDKRVLMLANHGVIVVGRSVAEAFDDLYFLERAAQVQVLAMGTGRKLKLVDIEVVRRTAAAFAEEQMLYAHQHFAALKRLLDKEDPTWRD